MIVLFFMGCAHGANQSREVYAHGYQDGVREQVRDIVAQFQGGRFPYYQWAKPMVQEVRVPAHIDQGVFIPEHNELVIIKPGQWATSQGQPIASQVKESYE